MSTHISSRQLREQLSACSEPTYRSMMTAATMFVAVGSTACEITLSIFHQMLAMTDGRLPGTVRFVLIDADRDPRNPSSLNERWCRFVSLGQTGAGTVLANGRKLARAKFPDILKSLRGEMSALARLSENQFPVNQPASEAQKCVIIAGQGGTGGGAHDTVVTATHVAANGIGLSDFDVDLITVGGEMPVRDVKRHVSDDRVQLIAANAAENASWSYAQMATRRMVAIDVPGRGNVRMLASERLRSKIEFDWASETTKLATNEELIAMMSLSLFQRYFTAVGTTNASRRCDDLITGFTGQRSRIEEGVNA